MSEKDKKDPDLFCSNRRNTARGNSVYPNDSNNFLNVFTGSVWENCYGVIYLLTDTNIDGALPNRMYYIGVTIRKLQRRFLEHLRSTENGYLEKAFNRYHKKFKVVTINESFSSTDGNEFTIEVIDYARDFIELGEKEKGFINKYKTFIYDHFTIINNEFIPLYGYNLTRRGYSRPTLYGFLSPRYINIPKDDFKKLITLGCRTQEIAREFNIALSTVHTKIIEFWGDQEINNINSARKAFGGWDAFKSRGNIDVNLEELIQLIEDGAFMHEICDKLGVSRFAVGHRLVQLGASDLTHARFIFGGMEIYKKRLEEIYKGTLFKNLNYQYVSIPKNELKDLIEKGFDEFKIAKKYNVSNVTVRARVREHWELTFFEVVLLFRIFKQIDESFLESLIQNRLSVTDIERLFFLKLIFEGHTPTSISKYYSFTRNAITNRIKKSLGMTFNDAQDIYFYKPRIIEGIKNGARNAVDIASLLKINSHTVVSHMKKIWLSEFLNLYDSDYSKNSQRHFNNLFHYLTRFYKVYPKLDNNLLIECIFQKLSPKEINAKFLKYKERIKDNFSKRNEFYENRINKQLNKILSFLKVEGKKTIREIMDYLNVSKQTVYDRIHSLEDLELIKKEKLSYYTYYYLSSDTVHI